MNHYLRLLLILAYSWSYTPEMNPFSHGIDACWKYFICHVMITIEEQKWSDKNLSCYLRINLVCRFRSHMKMNLLLEKTSMWKNVQCIFLIDWNWLFILVDFVQWGITGTYQSSTSTHDHSQSSSLTRPYSHPHSYASHIHHILVYTFGRPHLILYIM